jgi:hypothetical protein
VYFMQEFDGFELRYVEFSIDHGEIGCFWFKIQNFL